MRLNLTRLAHLDINFHTDGFDALGGEGTSDFKSRLSFLSGVNFEVLGTRSLMIDMCGDYSAAGLHTHVGLSDDSMLYREWRWADTIDNGFSCY